MKLGFWQKAAIRLVFDDRTLNAIETMFDPNGERGAQASVKEGLNVALSAYAAGLRKAGKNPANTVIDVGEFIGKHEMATLASNAGFAVTGLDGWHTAGIDSAV